MRLYLALLCILFQLNLIAQDKNLPAVPSVYSGIDLDKQGQYYFYGGKDTLYERKTTPFFTLKQAIGKPTGFSQGLYFDFDSPNLKGTLYFGLIPYGDSKHPQPVYFKRIVPIVGGKASIPIKSYLSGVYDMVGWQESERGTIGYRLVNEKGEILYDGIVSFKGKGPFEIASTIVEGPFVNQLTAKGATISFTTLKPEMAEIEINGKVYKDESAKTQHEIVIDDLNASTNYDYVVKLADNEVKYAFKTAPEAGSRSDFTFAYASDSRNGNGGGERNVYGANYYIMKKIMALNSMKGIAFFQFSGDLINGYLHTPDEINLQYANWKRAVEPFWHYFPVYCSMGNHEALMREFSSEDGVSILIDRFPFETESAEAVFANNFVHPTNGPESEDGASYDPSKKTIDFPSYKENVFYYTYDNVAVVVMNSNYLYAPSTSAIPYTGGGLHAYIMDQQLDWIKNTIASLEDDDNIDHVFITEHTPFFPNGGHVRDDMWYNGDNNYRPYVAGKPLKKGIIERRDELLEIFVNKSSKVRAILTGDEHNYARTTIEDGMDIYPSEWSGKKVKLSRRIYQINNGAAGAPYYAQEQTPWTPKVEGFTTQNALVFFHVSGKKITMEVLNPDTLEEVDELLLFDEE